MSSGSVSSGGQKVDVTKEMEKHVVQLMLNGQSPADAMNVISCQCVLRLLSVFFDIF